MLKADVLRERPDAADLETMALQWITSCPLRPEPPIIPGVCAGTITVEEAMANVRQRRWLVTPANTTYSQTAVRVLVQSGLGDESLAYVLGVGHLVGSDQWPDLRRELKLIRQAAREERDA